MSFISSFEIIKVVIPVQEFFCLLQHLWPMQLAVSPNIPRGLTTDFNNTNPDFNNGAKNLKNPPFPF